MTSAPELVDATTAESAATSTGDTTPSPLGRHSRVIWLAAFMVIPIVAIALPYLYYLYGGTGYTDPFFYTAYSESYGDMLARFGRTYYSTRVTGIWPNAVAIQLFGEAHYQIVRTVYYLMVGIGAFLAMPRRIATTARVAAAVACMASIELAYSFATEYTGASAIAYSFVAVGVLLRWRTLSGALVVGAFFSLAFNSYEGTLYVAIAALTATAATTVSRAKLKHWFATIGCWAVGFLAVQIGLSIAMGLAFGWTESNWGFQLTSIKTSLGLAGGGSVVWSEPFRNPYIAVFFSFVVTTIVAVLLLIKVIRSKRSTTRTERANLTAPLWWAVITTLIVTALLLVSHFVVHDGILGLPYAISIILPLSAIIPWLLLFTTSAKSQYSVAIPYAVAVLVCLVPLLGSSYRRDTGALHQTWLALAAGAIVLGTIAAAIARKNASELLAAFGCACLVGTFAFAPLAAASQGGAAYYDVIVEGNGGGLNDRDVQVLAPQYFKFVTAAIAPQDSFVVWYPEDVSGIDSIKATLLPGNCLGCEGTGGAPFPQLNALQAAALSVPHNLVILTDSSAKQQAALAQINKLKNLRFVPVKSTTLRAGATEIFVTILQISLASPPVQSQALTL